MDEDRFNMAVRKFLKEVGVTSQREIERIVRDGLVNGSMLRLRMTLTSDDAVPKRRRMAARSFGEMDGISGWA